jgi:fatty-acyl-CoA synthase/long-chain acyl-CoA synthetase
MVIPALYDAERVLQLIQREKCVSRSGYGAMYIMEMNHPRFAQYDISSLRSGWCVGTPALMQKVRDTFGIAGLVQIYGSTEVGCTAGEVSEPWAIRSTSCGRPLTGMELLICDPKDGRPLPPGETGEIVMRGWHQMIGYFNDPAATAKAVDTEGRVHTGDLGWVDESGYLHFAGRVKDMLKVGGENVSAEEVESFLLTHPDITQVAVIGAPDERLQEVVMAVIETRPGSLLTAEELVGWCKTRLANFRVPRYVRFIDEWPMTGSGKIQKNKLRERFHAGLGETP